MPFTPFHMGPGLLIKSFTDRYFSLMVFGFSQVAMDTEVLYHMMRKDELLHGFNHTYVGGTVVALISVLIGRPCCQILLNRWNPVPGSTLENWLRAQKSISLFAAVSGAFLGTYSHVFLDSIMHIDLYPLMPWSKANSLLGFIAVETLYSLCIVSSFLGGVILLIRYFLTTETSRNGDIRK